MTLTPKRGRPEECIRGSRGAPRYTLGERLLPTGRDPSDQSPRGLGKEHHYHRRRRITRPLPLTFRKRRTLLGEASAGETVSVGSRRGGFCQAKNKTNSAEVFPATYSWRPLAPAAKRQIFLKPVFYQSDTGTGPRVKGKITGPNRSYR